MNDFILKENIVAVYASKSVGVESIKLQHLVESLSLFLSMDVRQVPFEPLEPVEYPFVVFQFYKACSTKDQKVKLQFELNRLVDILLRSGYFLDVFFQMKECVS